MAASGFMSLSSAAKRSRVSLSCVPTPCNSVVELDLHIDEAALVAVLQVAQPRVDVRDRLLGLLYAVGDEVAELFGGPLLPRKNRLHVLHHLAIRMLRDLTRGLRRTHRGGCIDIALGPRWSRWRCRRLLLDIHVLLFSLIAWHRSAGDGVVHTLRYGHAVPLLKLGCRPRLGRRQQGLRGRVKECPPAALRQTEAAMAIRVV